MSSVCEDCDGRGQWASIDKLGFLVTQTNHFCESCGGKGYTSTEEDQDDFDLAGVGVTEEDDE